MAIVRGEKPEERGAVEDLLRRAYGREDEARLLASLRNSPDFVPQMSVVADMEGVLAGYALFMKADVAAGNETYPSLALVLLTVLPEHKRSGVAERLIRHSVERSRGLGLRFLFVIGEPAYFSRFGFKKASDLGLEPDFHVAGGALQVLPLQNDLPERINGKVRYSKNIQPG